MSIVTWIEDKKRQKVLNAPKYVNPAEDSNKGLWTRCDKCGVILYIKHLKENQRVCFGCSYHLQMSSQERIDNLLDKSSWRPLDETLSPCDPLEFHDQKNYTDRLQDAQERTGLQDAIQTGTGMIDGIPVALGVMDFSFMGGSMGSVVGEKITRLIEYASQEGLTLLIVCASGGARMQEGVFSLMQMAKISSALQIYQSHANLLYISIITSPTTGGVTASFAMLGDIIFAEPKALIAFAGRRVIEQTLREDLPDDFQTSEYMLHHGLVDLIVPRRFLRQALSESIRLYQNAPFKRPGRIPFGVQNPISFLTEEKVRRKWGTLTDQNFDIKTITKKPVSLGTNVVASRNGMQKVDSQGLQSKALHSRNLVNSQKSSSKAELCYTLQDQDLLEQDLFDKTRQSMEYRDILTSFEMMFNLFSKESYIPDSLNSDKTSTNESEAYQSLCKASPCKTSSFLLSSLRNVSSYPQKALFSKKLGRSFYQNNGAHKQVVEKSNKAVFGLSPKSLQVQAKQGLPLPEGSHRHSSHSLNSIHLKRVLTKERDKFLPEIPFLNSPKSVLRLYPNIVQVHIQKPLFVFHPQSRKIKAIDSDSTFRFESSLTKRSCLHLNHSKLGTSIERVKRTREPSVVLAIQALRKQSPPKDKLEGAKQKTALGKIAALARTFPQQRVHTKLTNAQQSFARKYEQAIDSPNGTSPFLDLGFVVSPLPKTGSSQNVFYRNLQKKVEQTFIKVVSKRGDVLPEESNSNGDHRNIQELYSSSSGAQNGASHKLLLHSFRSLSETESFLSKQDDKRSNLGSPPLQNKSLQTDTQLKSLQKQHKSMLTNRSSVGMKLLDLIALNTTELAQNSFASSSADALCPAYSRQDLTKQNFVGTNQDSSASKNLPKEYKTDGFAKQNQETDIDFLNQAIEMAATESVEWKAFYLHQRLSKTTGFLEDFIKPVLDVQVEKDRNLLLYRSICRKSKQVDL